MTGGVRARNAALNLREFRDGHVRLTSRPRYLLVELTQGCNLACPMCRPHILGHAGRRMPWDLFDRIAGELFPSAELVDLRGWGESLTLSDIDRYTARTAESGAAIRFVTNLAFPRDPSALLAGAGCQVAVSLDTVDPGLYGRLRGGADFAVLSRNLHHLAEAYRRRYASADRIHITTTVMAPTIDGLPSLVHFAADLGIREVRLFTVSAPPESALSLQGCGPRLDGALRRAAAAADERDVRLIAGTRLGSMPVRPAGGAACLHPWSYAAFGFDGGVTFCDHLIGPDGQPYVLGSLHTDSFEDIWNGPAWTTLRREHREARRAEAPLFHDCAWCYRDRLIDFEHQFDPSLPQVPLQHSCGRSPHSGAP